MSRTTTGFYPWEKSKNTLLLKDDVGRSKQSAYDLPQQQFVYGKPLPRDQEGAKEVTMTWKFHNETRDKQPQRDFKQLNKMSIQQGLYKATDFSNYRKETDARQKVKKGKNALPLYIPEEEFRYGRVNRPSTPIHLIVGNCYGIEHQMRQTDLYRYRTEQEQFGKPKLLPRGNKASVLSYSHTKEKLNFQNKRGQQQTYFKLSKYRGVTPRTNTNLYGDNKSIGRTSNITSQKEQQQNQQDNQVQNQQFDEAYEAPEDEA